MAGIREGQGDLSGRGRKTGPALAIALMLGAGAFVAATALLAKTLGSPVGSASGLHPLQISAGRFVFALLALLLLLVLRPSVRPSFAGTNWRWHLLRCFFGWLGVTSMFAAVGQMAVAEATAISFLSPLITMGLAVVFLGDRIGVRTLGAATLAVVGAFLILRPGTQAFQVAGVFALAAALFMGVEAILIKRLSDTEPALRILLINNLLGAALALSAAALVWTAPTATQWAWLVMLGVLMVMAQSLFIQSMKRGLASIVMPAFYSVLVFAAVFDFAFYGVVPTPLAAMGAVLILLGALILAAKDDTR